MEILPKDLQNIVYKYIHNMNMNDIQLELTTKNLPKYINIYCDNCNKDVLITNWFICIRMFCSSHICMNCVKKEKLKIIEHLKNKNPNIAYEESKTKNDVQCSECLEYYKSLHED